MQRGFAGLAQIPQWLTELDDGTPDRPDGHRLASLFKPRDQELPMWRIVDPLLRRSGLHKALWHCWWAQRTRCAWVGLILALIALFVPIASIHAAGRSWVVAAALGIVGTMLVICVIAGMIAFAVSRGAEKRREKERQAQRRWSGLEDGDEPTPYHQLRTDHTSATAPSRRQMSAMTAVATLAAVALFAVVTALATSENHVAVFGRFIGAATALIVVNLALLATGAADLNRDAQYHGYGLLPAGT